mgnify:CR=1 FL=1
MNNSSFIIYGISGRQLFFYTNSKTFYNSTELDNISYKLSCKFVEGDNFICVFIGKSVDFYYIHFDKDSTEEPLGFIYSEPLFTDYKYSDLVLYDTSERNLKFLCATIDGRIDCIFFRVRYNEQDKNHYFKDKLLSFNINYFLWTEL